MVLLREKALIQFRITMVIGRFGGYFILYSSSKKNQEKEIQFSKAYK